MSVFIILPKDNSKIQMSKGHVGTLEKLELLGYRPYQQGARRCNPKILPDIKAEITQLIEANFIWQCHYAEWISNVVPVYKKNGKL